MLGKPEKYVLWREGGMRQKKKEKAERQYDRVFVKISFREMEAILIFFYFAKYQAFCAKCCLLRNSHFCETKHKSA
jgi:hypothetical protein